jgi:hypothetical protein
LLLRLELLLLLCRRFFFFFRLLREVLRPVWRASSVFCAPGPVLRRRKQIFLSA